MENSPDRDQGLTDEQVAARRDAGQTNRLSSTGGKTIGQIIAGNLFTFFNLINVLIFFLILLTGQYANTLFMGVIISNVLIGIIQEIRAKVVTDKLKVLTQVHASVIRNGRPQQVSIEEIVLDDVLVLMPGGQIGADAVVLTSQELEVDEAMLTGESVPVIKKAGDKVYSGSFVVSGSATATVTRIGDKSFAQSITAEVRKYKRARSEIQDTLARIIRFISPIIIPIGALLFFNQYLRDQVTWEDAVVSSAADMIGMIPEGLVLLTSITLAVSVTRLARQRTLVQELAGIEVLARVNTLCLDKTGTLTLGTLRVADVIRLAPEGSSAPPVAAGTALAAVVGAFDDRNATASVLEDHFGPGPDWPILARKPFASARKWSSVTFAEKGTWYLGSAAYILADRYPDVMDRVRTYAAQGFRIVLLAWSPDLSGRQDPVDCAEPIALVLMADTIRPEAKASLAYFSNNDVKIKIISGDHPATVAAVATELELEHADQVIDAATIPDDPEAVMAAAKKYTVFGHVTPEMKKALVHALKADGDIVAMTGDGINDVPALREADCSIVMASGSDAAKGMSHILLLDSDFTVLPEVVKEGRQVIANIERVASLFLVKTTYASILAFIFIVIGRSYPFDPVHQTLISSFTIGIPSFFLALEKNHKRIQPGFLRRVISIAVPGGLTISLLALIPELLQIAFQIEEGQIRLITVVTTAFASLLILIRICLPLNFKRILLIVTMAACFVTGAIVFAEILRFPVPETRTWLITAILVGLAWPLLTLFRKISNKLSDRLIQNLPVD